ncbi:MAG: trigger factor [Lachnospiraceae bacterium]|nr:trigger factor [Lachnospiraceae bacterium]
MKKMNQFAVCAAAAAIAAACVLGGCSGSTAETTAAAAETTAAAASTAAGETAAAETTAAETTAAELTGDAKEIAEIDPVMPNLGNVSLGDLSSIEVVAPLAQEIKKEDVDTYIQDYIFQGQMKDVDRPAENGDTVNIDFMGKIDGVAFEGGTGSDYDLELGSDSFIDGFEDGLLGVKTGESRDLNLKFPEDYGHDDLNGKDVVFEVTVNAVKRPMTVEDLTDEIANQYSSGTYKTAEEYRQGVQDALELSADALAKGELYGGLIQEASKLSEATITDEAVDWQLDLYLQNYDKTLQSNYGFGLADYLSMYGQAYSDFRTSLKEGAALTAEQSAVVHAIAREYGLEYNEETLKQYLDEYGYDEELVKNNSSEAWLEETVIQYLVAKKLMDEAEISYIPYEEYEEQQIAEMESAAAASESEAAAAETQAETKAE